MIFHSQPESRHCFSDHFSSFNHIYFGLFKFLRARTGERGRKRLSFTLLYLNFIWIYLSWPNLSVVSFIYRWKMLLSNFLNAVNLLHLYLSMISFMCHGYSSGCYSVCACVCECLTVFSLVLPLDVSFSSVFFSIFGGPVSQLDLCIVQIWTNTKTEDNKRSAGKKINYQHDIRLEMVLALALFPSLPLPLSISLYCFYLFTRITDFCTGKIQMNKKNGLMHIQNTLYF